MFDEIIQIQLKQIFAFQIDAVFLKNEVFHFGFVAKLQHFQHFRTEIFHIYSS